MTNTDFFSLFLAQQVDFMTNNTVLSLILVVILIALIVQGKRGRRRGRSTRRTWNRDTSQSGSGGLIDRQLSALRSTTITTQRPVNRSAYRILVAIEDAIKAHAPRARVMPEVGMGAFLSTTGGGDLLPEDKEAFRAFVAKRVDFLIVDEFGHPAFAVEYQGSGHYVGGTAAGRDAVKREALRRAGVELVEIHAHSSAAERDALIAGAIHRNCKKSLGKASS